MAHRNMQALRTSNHAAFRLVYHIIFTVTYSRPAITVDQLKRLKVIFADVLEQWGCRLVECGGEADHVHLLIEGKPAMDLSRLVGDLKMVSARRMRSEFAEHLRPFFWKPYFWNTAYAVMSVDGRASIETLLQHIRDQDSSDDDTPKSSRSTRDEASRLRLGAAARLAGCSQRMRGTMVKSPERFPSAINIQPTCGLQTLVQLDQQRTGPSQHAVRASC